MARKAKETDLERYERRLKELVAFVKERCQKGEYPTWEETANKFGLTYDEIEDLISSSDDQLQDIAGIGVSGGMYAFRTRGEHQIEYQGG